MMRRTWLWCAVVFLGGCAPGNPGLLMGGVIAPTDSCLFEASSPLLLSGILDVAPAYTDPPQRVTYSIRTVLFNQLINLSQSGASGPPMADPNVIYVQQAEVELRDFNGTPLALEGLPMPYRVPATGFVPSAEGTEAGEGLGSMEIIPPVYGAALARVAVDSTIVASVRAIGRTAGDAEVISPELEFPIDICNHCLYGCSMDDEGRALCISSCTPGQDEVTISPGVCADPPVFGGCIASGT